MVSSDRYAQYGLRSDCESSLFDQNLFLCSEARILAPPGMVINGINTCTGFNGRMLCSEVRS